MITRTFLADLAERAGAQYVESFLGFLLMADHLNLSTVGVLALAALPATLSLVKNLLLEVTGTAGHAPNLYLDVLERAGVAYVVSFLGILLAAPALTIGAFSAAGVAALPATLAVVKGFAGTLFGRHDSASVLPANLDPGPVGS